MEQAQNTFNGGLIMDMNPTVTPNTVLTDCVNGTLITFDGNEFSLQSDMGNGKVESCRLKPDYIPLGIKEYGGFVYVVSQNPFTGVCEIGSFPSPERNITTEELPDLPNTILRDADLYKNKETSEGLQVQYLKVDLGDIENNILRPGDKFLIYISNTADNDYNEVELNTNFMKFVSTYNTLLNKGTRKVFKLHLSRIDESGVSIPIETDLVNYDETTGRFFYKRSDVIGSDTVKEDSYYSVYTNKINGFLAIVVEIEKIDSFLIDISNVKENVEDPTNKFDFEFAVESTSDSYNNIYGAAIKCEDSSPDVSYVLDLSPKENSETQYDNGDTSELCVTENQVDKSITGLTNIPKKKTTIKGIVKGLDKTSSYNFTIKPYSRFGYNKSLEYNSSIDFTKLTSDRSSTMWRYQTEFITDYNNNKYPQVSLSFDFFTRGTLNGRNRCTVMYIEFYDVWSDCSMIYPLNTVVSGSADITIPCFNGEDRVEPSYDQNLNPINNTVFNDSIQGGLVIGDHITKDSDKIFLLVDQSKSYIYLDSYRNLNDSTYGSKLDQKDKDMLNSSDPSNPKITNLSSGFDVLKALCSLSFKDGPCCIKISPSLVNTTSKGYTYNNFSTQTDLYVSTRSKLRYNNFYICRVCGLDICESTTEGVDNPDLEAKDFEYNSNFKYVQYDVFNTLYTNGWFNSLYRGPLADSTRNFSNIPIREYVNYVASVTDYLNDPDVDNSDIVVESANYGLTTKDLRYLTLPDQVLEDGMFKYNIEGTSYRTCEGLFSHSNLFHYGDIDDSNIVSVLGNSTYTIKENNTSKINSNSSAVVSIAQDPDNKDRVKIKVKAVTNRGVESDPNNLLVNISKILYIPKTFNGVCGNNNLSKGYVGYVYTNNSNKNNRTVGARVNESTVFSSNCTINASSGDNMWEEGSGFVEQNGIPSRISSKMNQFKETFAICNVAATTGGSSRTARIEAYKYSIASPYVVQWKILGTNKVSSNYLFIVIKNVTKESVYALPLFFKIDGTISKAQRVQSALSDILLNRLYIQERGIEQKIYKAPNVLNIRQSNVFDSIYTITSSIFKASSQNTKTNINICNGSDTKIPINSKNLLDKLTGKTLMTVNTVGSIDVEYEFSQELSLPSMLTQKASIFGSKLNQVKDLFEYSGNNSSMEEPGTASNSVFCNSGTLENPSYINTGLIYNDPDYELLIKNPLHKTANKIFAYNGKGYDPVDNIAGVTNNTFLPIAEAPTWDFAKYLNTLEGITVEEPF